VTGPTDLASRLAAADREVERLSVVALDIEKQRHASVQREIALELEAGRVGVELSTLRARIEALVRHLEHVGPCTLCGDRAQDLRDLLEGKV
jgi:hypothetical protein